MARHSSSQTGFGPPKSILWTLINEGYAPSKRKYSDALEEMLCDEITQSVDILAPWLNLGKLSDIGLLKPRKHTRILAVPPTGMSRLDAEVLAREAAKRPDLKIHQLGAGCDEGFPHIKLIRLDRGSDGKYIILGSSNLTFRGLESNWEANVLLPVQKVGEGDKLWKLFDTLWEKSRNLNPDSFAISCQPNENAAPRDLLDFQWDSYEELKKLYLAKPVDNGAILSLPTGTGKTMIATRFLLNHVLTGKDRRVLWVAPHEELLDQAYETFKDQDAFRASQIQIIPPKKSASGSFGNSHSNLEFHTLQSVKNGPPWKEFHCLVVDEAHWGASNNCSMLQQLVNKSGHAFRLGLTATPFRRCVEEIRHLMDRFCGQNLIGPPPDTIEEATNALGRRVLAKVQPESVQTNFSIRRHLDPQDFGVFEFEGKALRKFNDRERNMKIVDSWKAEKYGPTLVFAVGIDHANALAKLFNKQHPDKKVQVVHTGEVDRGLALVVDPSKDHKFSREDRRRIRDCFKDGQIDILVSVDLYIMGIDFPKVDTLFMARPTLSPVLYAQMVGRGRRGPAFRGTDTITVVDFADQKDAHDELCERIMHYTREQKWEEYQARTMKKWQDIKKRMTVRSVSDLLDEEIGPAVYMIVTERRRDLIRSMEVTNDLTASLRRGFNKGQYPIKSSHQVLHIETRASEDPREVYYLWKQGRDRGFIEE